MPVRGFNGVIDISHHNTVSSISKVKSDNIVAVVHKATEGRSYRDKEYEKRKDLFKSTGFKWGAYHFSSSANPILQVENFLQYAAPQADDLICLDYEASSSGTNMSYDQKFVELIHKEGVIRSFMADTCFVKR